MKLIDVTKDNWEKIILLTTDENGQHPLGEEFVASNAYSLLQFFYEPGWTVKAAEENDEPVGFVMYGWSEEWGGWELCRLMVDRKHQGRGYGRRALAMAVAEMKKQPGCDKIFLSTDPENARGKHLYETFGFVSTGRVEDGEEIYRLDFGK